MKKGVIGIVADGFESLLKSPWYRQKRAAIEAQVRAKHAEELAQAAGYWQRVKIEGRIRREIKRELQALGSPYCLWVCR